MSGGPVVVARALAPRPRVAAATRRAGSSRATTRWPSSTTTRAATRTDSPADDRLVLVPDPQPCDWGRMNLAEAMLRCLRAGLDAVPDLEWLAAGLGPGLPGAAPAPNRGGPGQVRRRTPCCAGSRFPATRPGDEHPWQARCRQRYLHRMRIPGDHRSVPFPRRHPSGNGTDLYIGDMWANLRAPRRAPRPRAAGAAAPRRVLPVRCSVPDEALLPTLLLNDADHLRILPGAASLHPLGGGSAEPRAADPGGRRGHGRRPATTSPARWTASVRRRCSTSSTPGRATMPRACRQRRPPGTARERRRPALAPRPDARLAACSARDRTPTESAQRPTEQTSARPPSRRAAERQRGRRSSAATCGRSPARPPARPSHEDRRDVRAGRHRAACSRPGCHPTGGTCSRRSVDRPLVVSFRLRPSKVLAGEFDEELTAWFRCRPRDRDTYWVYYHEPEDETERGTFTAEAFQRRMDPHRRARRCRGQPAAARHAHPHVLDGHRAVRSRLARLRPRRRAGRRARLGLLREGARRLDVRRHRSAARAGAPGVRRRSAPTGGSASSGPRSWPGTTATTGPRG